MDEFETCTEIGILVLFILYRYQQYRTILYITENTTKIKEAIGR